MPWDSQLDVKDRATKPRETKLILKSTKVLAWKGCKIQLLCQNQGAGESKIPNVCDQKTLTIVYEIPVMGMSILLRSVLTL